MFCCPRFELWKDVDDSTMSDTILKGQASVLNETKCKEMKIFLGTEGTPDLKPIVIKVKPTNVVSRARILNVNIYRVTKTGTITILKLFSKQGNFCFTSKGYDVLATYGHVALVFRTNRVI